MLVLSRWFVIVSWAGNTDMQGLSRLLSFTSCFFLSLLCNVSRVGRTRNGWYADYVTGGLKRWKTGLVSWFSVYQKDKKSLKLKATSTAPTWLFSLTSYCFIEPVQLQSWFRHLAGRLAISRPAALSGKTWRRSQNIVIRWNYDLAQYRHNRRDCGSLMRGKPEWVTTGWGRCLIGLQCNKSTT